MEEVESHSPLWQVVVPNPVLAGALCLLALLIVIAVMIAVVVFLSKKRE